MQLSLGHSQERNEKKPLPFAKGQRFLIMPSLAGNFEQVTLEQH